MRASRGPEYRSRGRRRRTVRRRWSEFDRGGHFAAMEVPDLFAGDVRDFFLTAAGAGDGDG